MGLEFDEQRSVPRQQMYQYQDQQKGLTAWIIKIGLAKDRKGANSVMLAIMVLFLALAFFIPKLFGSSATRNVKQVPPSDLPPELLRGLPPGSLK